ncbi:hypothetical protein BDR26DRAFT_848740 [Obelidium mucronatum]|nr:hypothetical protein BDR26DRAFT_848740 [Obelidium mucronatum]
MSVISTSEFIFVDAKPVKDSNPISRLFSSFSSSKKNSHKSKAKANQIAASAKKQNSKNLSTSASKTPTLTPLSPTTPSTSFSSSQLSIVESDRESICSDASSLYSFEEKSEDELTLDDSTSSRFSLCLEDSKSSNHQVEVLDIPSYEEMKRISSDSSYSAGTQSALTLNDAELPYSYRELYMISFHKLSSEKKPMHQQVLISNFIMTTLAPHLPEEIL